MSAAQINTRGEQAIGVANSSGAAGTLTVGPFAHPAFIYEIGALVVDTITGDPEEVNARMDGFAGAVRATFLIPVGATAGKVVRFVPTANPAAGVVVLQDDPLMKVSSPRGKLVMPPGATLAIDGEGLHTAGSYRLYVKYILQADKAAVEAEAG